MFTDCLPALGARGANASSLQTQFHSSLVGARVRLTENNPPHHLSSPMESIASIVPVKCFFSFKWK